MNRDDFKNTATWRRWSKHDRRKSLEAEDFLHAMYDAYRFGLQDGKLKTISAFATLVDREMDKPE